MRLPGRQQQRLASGNSHTSRGAPPPPPPSRKPRIPLVGLFLFLVPTLYVTARLTSQMGSATDKHQLVNLAPVEQGFAQSESGTAAVSAPTESDAGMSHPLCRFR